MKNRKSAHRLDRNMAFTLVEILVVVGIIAILITLLVPALTKVHTAAKETQQRAQLNTIELALTSFRDDYGDYPPSHGNDYSTDPPKPDWRYFGAMTLAEALVGWDLMGFHPNSAWRDDGRDEAGTKMVYLDGTETPMVREANLEKRKGPYLNVAKANVFRLGDLFPTDLEAIFNPVRDRFVICDVFGVKPVTVGGKIVKAGTPILYYKANTSSKTIENITTTDEDNGDTIYNRKDNYLYIYYQAGGGMLYDSASPGGFYDYIADSKVTAAKWPCNPESYLLISAGADGKYGTKDDICNFDPNVP